MALIAIASCRCSGKGPRAEGAMNLELRRLVNVSIQLQKTIEGGSTDGVGSAQSGRDLCTVGKVPFPLFCPPNSGIIPCRCLLYAHLSPIVIDHNGGFPASETPYQGLIVASPSTKEFMPDRIGACRTPPAARTFAFPLGPHLIPSQSSSPALLADLPQYICSIETNFHPSPTNGLVALRP